MDYCKDCRWFCRGERCGHPQTTRRNVVTGELLKKSCYDVRKGGSSLKVDDSGACGPSAQLFEQGEDKAMSETVEERTVEWWADNATEDEIISQAKMVSFARAIAAETVERCAAVAEDYASRFNDSSLPGNLMTRLFGEVVTAIRALKLGGE